ncbi:hypothetical protein FRC11_002209, partial [Ceratobasidium sp. 423]
MGNLTHPHWGPPLEQYVRHYDKASIRGRELIEDWIMSSAQGCIDSLIAISEETDDIEVDLLAKQVTLEMLRSLLLLSSSGQGVLYLARPQLPRGCMRLMKTVKVDGVVSPFSYEYGYLCFNIGKMALGVCLVEKFHRQHVANLMELIWTNYLTKDNPSILTEYLTTLFSNEIAKSPTREMLCDWVFGWVNPPAYGGHSQLLVAESDALDLMNMLWNDRKLFLKSLSSTYTPGASIMMLLIWQCMLRKRVFSTPRLQSPLLQPFLDLTWRFMLVATPVDYELASSPAVSTATHLGNLAKSAADIEDSRVILNSYIRGIYPEEDIALNRRTAFPVYAHLPQYVVVNTVSGTEDLFPAFIQSTLSRLWEMMSWEDINPPVGAIGLGFQDLL